MHEDQTGEKNAQRLKKAYPGQWAVVTGASEGIGKGYAFTLAASGYDVVLASRSQSKLDKVKMELNQAFPER
jgi:17beta-estradiol 17-dehydrogenase / very-long-chain 3-oxoacyl-CoA reductase